jgi:hypothetical protein
MQQIIADSFAVQVPNGWNDITETVESDCPPFTLARSDGVGALQFSIATYKSGPHPNPQSIDIHELLDDFGRSRDLGMPTAVLSEAGPPMVAAGNFVLGSDSVRVWYLSDGRNFAFITYTSSSIDFGLELSDCEGIVRSLEFRLTSDTLLAE